MRMTQHGCTVGLMTAMLAAAMLLGAAVPGLAAIDPPGCTANQMNIDVQRIPSVLHNHETVTYTVTAFNGAFPPACAVTGVRVYFWPPGPDGNPDPGSEIVLDVGAVFNPSDLTTYPAIPVTLNLNPGVAFASALAGWDGDLQDSPIPDPQQGTKTVTVTILEPCIEVTKTVDPTTSKAGDEVIYEICVRNCSDPDPEVIPTTLYDVTVVDTLLGDLSGDFADVLLPGQEECHSFPYVVQGGDPDPLVNLVTASGTDFAGLTVTDEDSAEVDLVHPDFTVTKRCFPDPVAVGETINWEVTIDNTGDVSLDYHVVDPVAGIDQTVTCHAPEDPPVVISSSRVVELSDAPAVSNTVTVLATLCDGILPNEYMLDATATCEVRVGEATRTPGYWFTHPDAMEEAFVCITGSPEGIIDLLCCPVSKHDAMAIFWRTSGGNRPTLAVHILSAMFNSCYFANPAPGTIIADGLAVLCNPGATSGEIGAVIGPLDAYNNSGTDITPPGFKFDGDPETANAWAALGTVPVCAAGKKTK